MWMVIMKCKNQLFSNGNEFDHYLSVGRLARLAFDS